MPVVVVVRAGVVAVVVVAVVAAVVVVVVVVVAVCCCFCRDWPKKLTYEFKFKFKLSEEPLFATESGSDSSRSFRRFTEILRGRLEEESARDEGPGEEASRRGGAGRSSLARATRDARDGVRLDL